MNRNQIENSYSNAVSKMNAATTESEFFAAESLVASLREQLIVAEASFPTATETKRASNKLYLRNRGFDL